LRICAVSMELAPDQFDANSVPAFIASCSTMGPSASAGKKVRPPMITITPTTKPTNRPPVVGKGPEDGGSDFFSAGEPPIAMAGVIIQSGQTSIAQERVRLKKKVWPERPAKAEPLLASAEV